MTEKMINNMIEMGATKWEKGGKSRLYLNAAGYAIVGLNCSYYNTGNIFRASMNGEHISNGRARSYSDAPDRAYIDLMTGKLHIANDNLRDIITDWMTEQEAIENETVYVANDENQDEIYGSEPMSCLTIGTIRELANGWGYTLTELLEQFHEASQAEIDEYGVYNG